MKSKKLDLGAYLTNQDIAACRELIQAAQSAPLCGLREAALRFGRSVAVFIRERGRMTAKQETAIANLRDALANCDHTDCADRRRRLPWPKRSRILWIETPDLDSSEDDPYFDDIGCR